MFALKLILMVAVVNLTTAWIAPERCQNYVGNNGNGTAHIQAQTTKDINESIRKYKEEVKSLYEDFKLYNVPTEGAYNAENGHINVRSTNNCHFYTYFRYQSENCGANDKCTIKKEVNEDSFYGVVQGRKWGSKVFNKTSSDITIGGEASTDGGYYCNYNKNRTSHRTVECSTNGGAGKKLYLYDYLTGMRCDIGTTGLAPDLRNNQNNKTAPANYFTKREKDELLAASITYLVEGLKKFHMDIDKISGGLFDKLMRIFPYYDFSTDTISIKENIVAVNYYQATTFRYEYFELIPFTDRNGDAIYKYMCLLK